MDLESEREVGGGNAKEEKENLNEGVVNLEEKSEKLIDPSSFHRSRSINISSLHLCFKIGDKGNVKITEAPSLVFPHRWVFRLWIMIKLSGPDCFFLPFDLGCIILL